MIKKFYHGIQKAVHQFTFKNVEEHLLLGSGGNQNLRPSCRRPPTRTFHTPVGTLRLDAPALVWVRSPNDGNKLGWSPLSTLPVSYFDVIFLMYLVSSGFSFKPTSSSSSSSSTQFSQEWARRKVVVKHSIKSKSNQIHRLRDNLKHSYRIASIFYM